MDIKKNDGTNTCCHWHATWSESAEKLPVVGEIYHEAKLNAYKMCFDELKKIGYKVGSVGDKDIGGVMAWLDWAIMECGTLYEQYKYEKTKEINNE